MLPGTARKEPYVTSEDHDEVLARKALAGDEDAFRVLFERHADLLEGRVRRQMPDAFVQGAVGTRYLF